MDAEQSLKYDEQMLSNSKYHGNIIVTIYILL